MPQYFKSSIIEGFVDLAKEKNLLPELVEKQTLKTASTNSQDNLSSDNQILSLIESMHDRGMFVQAENLSQSFMSYKQAQSAYKSDYSVLLTAAHPDGDARVSESGVFHTLESTQEAMLAALQKKASLIGMVSEALKTNSSMVKKADEPNTGDAREGGDPGTFFGDPPDGDKKESGDPDQKKENPEDNVNLSPEELEQLEALNEKITSCKSSIEKTWSDLINNKNNYSEQIMGANLTSGIGVFPNLKSKYLSFVGVGEGEYQSFVDGVRSIFGSIENLNSGGYTDNLKTAIKAVAKQQTPAVAEIEHVPPSLSQKFTYGTFARDRANYDKQPESWKNANPINPFSIKNYSGPKPDQFMATKVILEAGQINIQIFVGAIVQYYQNQYLKIFPEEKMTEFKKAVAKEIEDQVRKVYGIIKPLERLSQVSSKNVGIQRALVSKIIGYCQAVLKKIPDQLSTEWSNVFRPNILATIGIISSYLKSLDDDLGKVSFDSSGEQQVGPDLLKNLNGMLTTSRIMLDELRKGDIDKTTKSSIDEIIGNIDAVRSGIYNSYDSKTMSTPTTWAVIKENLGGVGQDLSSMTDLVSLVNDFYEGAHEAAGKELPKKRASLNLNGLSKFAAPKTHIGKPGAPAPKSPAPPGGGSSYQPSGKSPAFNVNVQTMQFAIQQYAATLLKNKKASDLAVSKMLSVGPKGSSSPANMDGVWGSQTAAALETSNEHIQGKPLVVRPTSLDADAKKNTEILVAAKNYVDGYSGGASPGGANNPELDRIEFGMNSDFGYTVIDGEKVLHSSDLNSLKSLYSFLYNNDLVSAIGEENERGYTIKMWRQIINGLVERAEQREASSTSYVKSNAASIFKRKMYNLRSAWKQFVTGIYKRFGTKENENFIVSEQFLSGPGLAGNSPSNSGNSGVDGFSSPGGKQNSKGNKGSGKSSLDGETYEVGGGTAGSSSFDDGDADPTVLPFTRTINFSNPWWGNTAIAQESPGQYLSIKGFAGSNATTRAQMMFSNDENMQSDQDLQEQYIVKNRGLRLDQDRGWDGETYWVFVAGQRNSIPLNTYPNFQKNFGLIQNQTILDKYRNYLQLLKQGLTSSYQTWIESGPAETAIEQVQHYHQRWVEAINNQINQVNRTFQKYR